MNTPRFCYLLLPALSAFFAGCGGEVRGPVTGKVTFQDQPLKEGIVIFSNAQTGVYMTAPLKPDGTYAVEMATGKGLPLGEYKVVISPPVIDVPVGPPKDGMPPPEVDVSQMPERYRNPETTPFTVNVERKGVVFDLKMTP